MSTSLPPRLTSPYSHLYLQSISTKPKDQTTKKVMSGNTSHSILNVKLRVSSHKTFDEYKRFQRFQIWRFFLIKFSLV